MKSKRTLHPLAVGATVGACFVGLMAYVCGHAMKRDKEVRKALYSYEAPRILEGKVTGERVDENLIFSDEYIITLDTPYGKKSITVGGREYADRLDSRIDVGDDLSILLSVDQNLEDKKLRIRSEQIYGYSDETNQAIDRFRSKNK